MNLDKDKIEKQKEERLSRFLKKQTSLPDLTKIGKSKKKRKNLNLTTMTNPNNGQNTNQPDNSPNDPQNNPPQGTSTQNNQGQGSTTNNPPQVNNTHPNPPQQNVLNTGSLQGLSDQQRLDIEAFISRRLNEQQHITITQVNTNIDIPQYDPQRMTTDNYFTNLEKYFRAQGYQEANFHNFLSNVMKGEYKIWYDAQTSEITSFSDFKYLFKCKFDNEDIERERVRKFYATRQRSCDPCEQFVYEMVALGRQILPHNDHITEKILSQVRDALHPMIGIEIANETLFSVDSFLRRIAMVHDMLNRQSRMATGKPADIPPLKGNRDEIIKAKNSQNSNTSQNFRGRGSYRGSHNNGNGRYHDQNRGHNRNYSSNEGNNNNFRNNNGNQHNNRDRDRSRESNQNTNNNNGNGNGNNNRGSRNDNSRGRGRGNHNGRGRNSMDMANTRCRKCNRFGHFMKDCTEGGIAMPMTAYQYEENSSFHQQTLNPSQNSNPSNQNFS